jgi:cell division protein FtsL
MRIGDKLPFKHKLIMILIIVVLLTSAIRVMALYYAYKAKYCELLTEELRHEHGIEEL